MGGYNEKLAKYLPDDFISDYQMGMNFFHLQLVELEINLFILRKILDFPFHLFTAPQGNHFFSQVFRNFAQISILIVTRLFTDQGAEWFTLPRFKNQVCQKVKEPLKDELYKRLEGVKFDKRLEELKEKARNARSEKIAHLKEDVFFGKEQSAIITVGELVDLKEALVSFYKALSFETEYMMLPLPYHAQINPGVVNVEKVTDIDRILDGIVKRSILIHLPEENPVHWDIRKEQMSKEDKVIYDAYRAKYDLPIQFGYPDDFDAS